MNSKKVIVLMVILIVLIVFAGGAFAYIYFFTDILKTNQQLFEKTASKTLTNVQEFVKDTNIDTYMEKKIDDSYENSGKVNITMSNSTSSNEKNTQKLSVDVEGSVDNQNKKADEQVKINFAENISLPINFVRNDDEYAFTSSEIVNKYVTVRNSNLKEFAKKLGNNSSSTNENTTEDIPDKFEINKPFTTDEICKIASTYYTVVKNNVSEENFSQEKENNKTIGYSICLNSDQINKINEEWINSLKTNDIITSKITDTSVVDYIADKIKNNENVKNLTSLKIVVYLSNKDDSSTKIKIIVNDNDSYVINCMNNSIKINGEYQNDSGENKTYTIALGKNISGDTSVYSIDTSGFDESNDNFNINIQISSMSTDNVKEEITYSQEYKNITYTNNVNFKDSVNTTTLNEENSVILNDYQDEELKQLVEALETQAFKVVLDKSIQVMAAENGSDTNTNFESFVTSHSLQQSIEQSEN